MPQFKFQGADALRDLDSFTQGFIEALFFTAPDGASGDPEQDAEGDLTQAGVDELAPETLARIVSDCKWFQKANAALLALAYESGEYDETQAGRDFLFTRNRHGVGFWDRDFPGTLGDALTAAAHRFSEGFDLYRGDDGRLYVF